MNVGVVSPIQKGDNVQGSMTAHGTGTLPCWKINNSHQISHMTGSYY